MKGKGFDDVKRKTFEKWELRLIPKKLPKIGNPAFTEVANLPKIISLQL